MIEYSTKDNKHYKKDLVKMIEPTTSYEETFTKLKNSDYFNEIRIGTFDRGLGISANPKPNLCLKYQIFLYIF